MKGMVQLSVIVELLKYVAVKYCMYSTEYTIE